MRLFICTDPTDETALDTLTDVLDGYRMTIDIDRMVGTRDSRPALQAAIQDCDAFVYALTPTTATSKRCLWEFGQAVDNDRPIVVALLEPVDPVPQAFEPYLAADLQSDEGREQLLDALYVVGATPPHIVVQLFRNRLLLTIVVLVGFLTAWLLAGPYSPLRSQVNETLREILAVADRTVDLSRPVPTRDPNDPALVAREQATLSANAESLFSAGQNFARAGNYEAAIDAYNQTLNLAPGSVGAHIARGNAFHLIGATDTAWGDFTRAIELAPNLTLPYLSRARFYIDVRQPEGALVDLDEALSIEPNNPEAYNLRGEALFLQANYPAAIAALNYAIELNPESYVAYANRGEVYRYQGRTKAARADFDAALEINSVYSVAYTRRGALLRSQNNTPAALRDFTRAVELDPNDAEARYGRASIYMEQGDYQAAVGDFTYAIASQSDDTNLYLLRASAYRCLQDPTLSVADFTTAATLDLDRAVDYMRRRESYRCGDDPPPEINPARVGATDGTVEGAYVFVTEQLAARARQAAAEGNIQRAAEDYALAITMTPSYTEAAALYHERGQMYERNDLVDRALADYRFAVDILPERSLYHVDEGRMLAAQGETEEAFQKYARALDMDSISIPAYLATGDLYLAEDQPELALNAYTRASYIEKTNVDVLTRRVRLLTALDDCKVAEADLQVLQNNAPDDPAVIAVADVFHAECTPSEG